MYLYLSLNERAVAQELINKVKSKCCGIKDNLEILTSEAGLEELMNKYSKRDEIN